MSSKMEEMEALASEEWKKKTQLERLQLLQPLFTEDDAKILFHDLPKEKKKQTKKTTSGFKNSLP